MKDNNYNALVIGTGSIGASKPDKYDSPNTKSILTHAHMYYSNPCIDRIYFSDIDKEKEKQAIDKWKGEKHNQEKVDIISVCVPTKDHFSVLKSVLQFKPKVVIAEKPFCSTTEEARIIVEAYRKENIPLLVNYTRRYNFAHQLIKDNINNNEIGDIQSCILYYGRGTKREGSHFIDLCNFWFGKFITGKIIPSVSLDDFSKTDYTNTVHLSYQKCDNIFMIPIDGRHFSIFEIDIIGSKERIKFTEHGNSLDQILIEDEIIYGEYKTMSNKILPFKTRLDMSLSNVLQNALEYIEGEAILICPATEAVKVHKVYDELGV